TRVSASHGPASAARATSDRPRYTPAQAHRIGRPSHHSPASIAAAQLLNKLALMRSCAPVITPAPQIPTPRELRKALKTRFGFTDFRPGQEAVVMDALAGRDLLAIMPTGGGKSLCFQLPALMMPGVTLVISPLIALMQDQVRLLQDNGIAATYINSTLDHAEFNTRMAALARGEYKLLYLAPERAL